MNSSDDLFMRYVRLDIDLLQTIDCQQNSPLSEALEVWIMNEYVVMISKDDMDDVVAKRNTFYQHNIKLTELGYMRLAVLKL